MNASKDKSFTRFKERAMKRGKWGGGEGLKRDAANGA